MLRTRRRNYLRRAGANGKRYRKQRLIGEVILSRFFRLRPEGTRYLRRVGANGKRYRNQRLLGEVILSRFFRLRPEVTRYLSRVGVNGKRCQNKPPRRCPIYWTGHIVEYRCKAQLCRDFSSGNAKEKQQKFVACEPQRRKDKNYGSKENSSGKSSCKR